jgi:hypothetical protein
MQLEGIGSVFADLKEADIRYFHDTRRKNDPNIPLGVYQDITYNELTWHRSRLEQVVK